ncbi:hypothetical protein [Oceanibacterium hippocampi]|uniref:Uncharacterized protein n=1 Tax=Oceanibacterium hippocampi TaxID=745714 RepID=A0A1Y5TPN6_9PROT|nr:hypothetical protein [Oceanibacterium hippocampi]SLN68989.1 hypothetical protein OCH7691_03144 [Oceanibacterium hippocampi]
MSVHQENAETGRMDARVAVVIWLLASALGWLVIAQAVIELAR